MSKEYRYKAVIRCEYAASFGRTLVDAQYRKYSSTSPLDEEKRETERVLWNENGIYGGVPGMGGMCHLHNIELISADWLPIKILDS